MARRKRSDTLNDPRLQVLRDEMEKTPLGEAEVQRWLSSLSDLDDATGKAEQLRVCRDLLDHAPGDEMLDSDVLILVRSIEQLERELTNEIQHPARRPVRSSVRRDRELCDEDDVDPEPYASGGADIGWTTFSDDADYDA